MEIVAELVNSGKRTAAAAAIESTGLVGSYTRHYTDKISALESVVEAHQHVTVWNPSCH